MAEVFFFLSQLLLYYNSKENYGTLTVQGKEDLRWQLRNLR